MENKFIPNLGYDTLHFTKPLSAKEQRDTIQYMKNNLQSYKYVGRANGHKTHSANMNNLRLTLSDKITITGSIPKFFEGQNINCYSESELEKGINVLSDTLSIDLFGSKVIRIDFAATFETTHAPQNYFPFLGKYLKFRTPKGSTLTYSNFEKNSTFQNQFYDKCKELKANKQAAILGKNLMRNEIRFIGIRGIKEIKHPSVIELKTLCEPSFFNELSVKFVNEFEKINKISSSKISNLLKMQNKVYESPKDFKDELLSEVIKMIGIENLPNLDNIKFSKQQKMYKSRLKKEMNDLINRDNHNQNDELISELETKIRALKGYQLRTA
jgi:hypothetical protein